MLKVNNMRNAEPFENLHVYEELDEDFLNYNESCKEHQTEPIVFTEPGLISWCVVVLIPSDEDGDGTHVGSDEDLQTENDDHKFV